MSEATKRSRPRRAPEPVPGSIRRRFLVGILVVVEVDQRLIDDVLTDEWRSQFYGDVRTAEDVASHLAFNLVQNRSLESLDGFADQAPDRARVVDVQVDEDDLALEILDG